ncbi:MAG: glycosyltransferase family 9 protein [Phenylobacterium sp.]
MSSPPPTYRAIDIAYTLHMRGDLAQAEARYRAIVDAGGGEAMDARNNLVGLYREQHRWAEAEAVMRDALAVRPADDDWRFRLGCSRLADGDFAEGWPLFEARRGITRGRVAVPPLPFPEWRGEPVASLLVWPEQGFGDVIQFARYLPRVRARGIAVTLVCKAPLARLLSPFADRVVALQSGMSLPAQDAWCLIGSLPMIFGTTLATVPPPAFASAPGGGSGLGVVTRGDPVHFNDANRSLNDEAAGQLMALPGAISLRPEDTGAADFQTTAERIADLAAVVTVDTAVAHLAASLGKPTWIALPYLNPDWRWLRERSDSPWYPSARLIRQPAPGDWRSVIDAVKQDLADRAP